MKRSGSLYVEVIVGIIIFLIGVLALASSLAFSLKAVTDSRQALPSDASVENVTTQDLVTLMVSQDAAPDVSLHQEKLIGNTATLTFTGLTNNDSSKTFAFKYSLNRYKTDNPKYATTYYLIRREK